MIQYFIRHVHMLTKIHPFGRTLSLNAGLLTTVWLNLLVQNPGSAPLMAQLLAAMCSLSAIPPVRGDMLHLTLKRQAVRVVAVSLDEFPPNAIRRKRDSTWRGGFSLGLDLGLARTGVALSKGFSYRPLTVLELRGQKLELRILDIADKEEVDEFIIGLPLSSDGRETPQSNKVRSVAGRFAVRAAERGWRVYLQEEHGTTIEAMSYMVDSGLGKSARQGKQDAYAAAMVLQRYFSESGERAELVLPKQLDLQEKLRKGCKDVDYFSDEYDS